MEPAPPAGFPFGPLGMCAGVVLIAIYFFQNATPVKPKPKPRPYSPWMWRMIFGSKRTSCTCWISVTGPSPWCGFQVSLGIVVQIAPGDFEDGRNQCQAYKNQFVAPAPCTAGHVNCR